MLGLLTSCPVVSTFPSFISFLPGLYLLKFQLLPWVVIFHSGVLWEKNRFRSSSFSLLSNRKGEKNLDFSFLFFYLFFY